MTRTILRLATVTLGGHVCHATALAAEPPPAPIVSLRMSVTDPGTGPLVFVPVPPEAMTDQVLAWADESGHAWFDALLTSLAEQLPLVICDDGAPPRTALRRIELDEHGILWLDVATGARCDDDEFFTGDGGHATFEPCTSGGVCPFVLDYGTRKRGDRSTSDGLERVSLRCTDALELCDVELTVFVWPVAAIRDAWCGGPSGNCP